MNRRFPIVALALLCLPGRAALADMTIKSAGPNVTDRFYVGADKAFVGAGYDFSGVGKTSFAPDSGSTSQWATLISPNFVLTAAHYPATGSVTFVTGNDPNGPSYTFQILGGGVAVAGTDLYLEELKTSTTVPGSGAGSTTADGITSYAIANDHGNSTSLYGAGMLNVGQGNGFRVGTNNIDRVLNTTDGSSVALASYFDYNTSAASPATEDWTQPGDSGAPSFIPYGNKQLALVGLRWFYDQPGNAPPDTTGGPPYTPYAISGDTYLPAYVAALDSAMQSLWTQNGSPGPADQVTVVDVPEPAGVALLALGATLVGTLGRLARRRRPDASSAP